MPMKRGMLMLVMAPLVGACGQEAPETLLVERSDSAGVRIVSNSGTDRPLGWSFEPVIRIGGAEEGPESFHRVGRESLGVDGEGNLYVLDGTHSRVVVFDSSGRHIRTLGRPGGGPGELQIPFGVHVAADGTVHVLDITKSRLVGWNARGEVLGETPPTAPGMNAFAVVGGALVGTAPARSRTGEGATYELRAMRSADTALLASLTLATSGLVDYGCVRVSLPPVFTPLPVVWTASADRVAIAPEATYAVQIHEGDRVLSVRRGFAPRPVTREMAMREIGEEMIIMRSGGPCRIPADRVVEGRGYTEYLPAIGEIALAPDGGIWVRRGGVKDESPTIDVFEGSGAYLGTLPLGSPFPAAFTPDGDLFAIERDPMDVDHVVRYRVNRRGTGNQK